MISDDGIMIMTRAAATYSRYFLANIETAPFVKKRGCQPQRHHKAYRQVVTAGLSGLPKEKNTLRRLLIPNRSLAFTETQ